MAAIDKIYLNSYEEYSEFKKWCLEQPKLKDKYGREESISDYLFSWFDDSKEWEGDKSHPVMSAPFYVDAYIIRNCPIDAVQKELMLNYGYWTQERIKEYYEDVKNWNGEGKYPYWAKLEDFITLDDGTMTIKGLEKSDYEKIKDNELYTSPTLEGTYEVGKHFKIVKKAYRQVCNYPMPYYNKPNWSVKVRLPEDFDDYLWWHDSSVIGTWDFISEYVSNYKWSSSSTWCPSLKSIKRRILKWKLPVGTIVTLSGVYVDEYYEILVKK